LEPQERNERVCGESPAPMLILMEDQGHITFNIVGNAHSAALESVIYYYIKRGDRGYEKIVKQ
jgi:hypothetical protein